MEMPKIGDREGILASVLFGEVSPTLAENWVKNIGLEPFPLFSNIAEFDPMGELEWTLPMAAAWFIWRSVDAVRDQWIHFRRAWLANAEPSILNPPMDVSLPKLFGWADLTRFQIRPNRPYGMPTKELPRSCRPSPVGRLEEARHSKGSTKQSTKAYERCWLRRKLRRSLNLSGLTPPRPPTPF